MIHFDFRVPYARADEYGMARRAIVTYSKQPERVIPVRYRNGVWIELGICTIRFEWESKV